MSKGTYLLLLPFALLFFATTPLAILGVALSVAARAVVTVVPISPAAAARQRGAGVPQQRVKNRMAIFPLCDELRRWHNSEGSGDGLETVFTPHIEGR